jgi:hypothetical protein
MKELPFVNLSTVYLELTRDSLKALRDNEGIEFPLEHAADGRLTPGCRDKIIAGLQQLVRRKSWQPRIRAVCAIGARGVTLRRVSLPAGAREDVQKLLRLQIESEFPLPPEELAWGYRLLSHLPANGAPARQEFLISAVKKDRVEEYAAILLAAGLNPVFTVAALARSHLCPQPLGSCAVLDLGRQHSEMVVFENGVPGAVRVFSWGTDNAAGAAAAAESIAKAAGSGSRIFVTAPDSVRPALVAELGTRLGNSIRCEPVETPAGAGRSAAVLGLKRADEQKQPLPQLALPSRVHPVAGRFVLSQPEPRKWALRCAILTGALLLLPLAEAMLLKRHLARTVGSVRAQQSRLSTIDQEFRFLGDYKQNLPPYLDALYLVAKAAPPGAKLDTITMNRHGELSLRGSLKDAVQVTDFRSKLIGSGFFDRVTVEEQTPTPDRQKMNVRISGQWKTPGARAALAIGPGADEIEKAKTNKTAAAGGGMPAGMMMP